MKRYTKKIKNANNYCEYDLKYSPYKEMFDLTSNVQIEDYVNADLTLAIDKLGKLEDLEEEIGVNNLIAFLEWCVKFRNNFINRSFDDMVAFYKRAMCVTEKDKSE